jgi:hypothetical protein
VVCQAMTPSRGPLPHPPIPSTLRTRSRGGALEHSLPISSARRGSAGGPDTIRLRRSTLHILWGVHMPVASRAIREAIAAGRSVTGLVPPLVEEYILKEGLYRPHHGESVEGALRGA